MRILDCDYFVVGSGIAGDAGCSDALDAAVTATLEVAVMQPT